jgi:hypothetical protein
MFSVLIGAVYGTMEEYWGMYFRDLGFRIALIGIISSIMLALQAGASIVTPHIQFGPHFRRNIAYMTIINSLLMIVGLVLNMHIMVGTILLAIAGMTIVMIKMQNRIQQSIRVDERATVTSLHAFLLEIAAIVMFAIIGLVARWWDLRIALITVSMLAGGVGVLILMVFYNKKN